MNDPWVSLLIAGAILLAGFLASLSFDRFHVPDFIVLIALGIVLGHIPVSPFGSTMVDSLQPVLPAFTALTLAFILFEGGLTLRLEVERREMLAILGHIAGAMALTFVLVWFLVRMTLHLDELTSLVLAAAFAGPSATIATSFARRLAIGEHASGVIVLEGVLTNVIAVVLVVFLLNYKGAVTLNTVLPYAIAAAVAAVGAFVFGAAWHLLSHRLAAHKFVAMATVALAIVVYAVFEGFVGSSGAVAAFVFGFAVGYVLPSEGHDDGVKAHDGMLKTFQSEVAFALRTFFFVYLGLLITLEIINAQVVIVAVLISIGMILVRVPSTLGLSYVLILNRVETRAVLGNVARGMTDVILVLLALQSGVLPPSDTGTIIATLTIVVLLSAAASAALLFSAGRDGARRPPQKKEGPPKGLAAAPVKAEGSGSAEADVRTH